MKKFIGLILIGLFIIVLAACSSDEVVSVNGNASTSTNNATNTIALGHTLATTEDSAYQQFAMKFKEIIESETNGEVTVEIYGNGVLGAEREMVEAVEIGTLDAVLTSTGPLGNFTRLTYVMDFPFLFNSNEHVYKVLDGEIGDELAAALDERGLKVLAWAESGFASVTTADKPIKSPEDYKGLKIRSMENEIQIEAYKAFGAQPTPMAFTEIFTALQQGVIDGQANSIGVTVPNKFHEVQKYLTLTEQFYFPTPFIMNEDKFNSFSKDLQEVIVKAAAEARDHEREFLKVKNIENLKIMEDAGVTIIPKEEIDLEAFKKAVEPVYEKYADQYGEYFEKIRSLE